MICTYSARHRRPEASNGRTRVVARTETSIQGCSCDSPLAVRTEAGSSTSGPAPAGSRQVVGPIGRCRPSGPVPRLAPSGAKGEEDGPSQ
ncbi:MAG: hypothetical protein JWR82_1694 [Blastococcus sp.]|jgi:hypothetical protein|nr:hypothetical protein [Blastococcus sp.]